ncbi:C-type lectin domain family 6 member A-like [Sebastes umbrosus]|uniref:C-type lectin domain family 6 member A-like n=1 Tax=Sebastes umbrosus TaxID=72105 RepID=UPI0018A05FE7|nr:C-type lectin domain family 6 member A-like [Sebastes umbrosus]XP_037651913.1 C-type lectin domain family 6 member A-like [Sebastes umbrosus]XP_037651919.1 C-type lectin domain family 6 member A-like [Sebastes umbrosus]XP_037651920.1 C-type lectin domain family 6 member A-like [Sebastes umbrosus]XP_037651925.1 C-type lectin domain family 6 member A-like [Sebastes umbrosus]
MTGVEDVQLDLRQEDESADYKSALSSVIIFTDEEESDRRQMQNSWLKRLRSNWQAVLIVILVVLFCSVTAVHIVQMYELQRLKAESQLMEKTTTLLQIQNNHRLSILSSDKMDFVWKFCNETTLQCARCEPGWVLYDSRCFFLSPETDTWERARSKCIAMGGDLAVVFNAEDQEFLTNLTFDFHQQHPNGSYLAAWIGLQDIVQEGNYQWVDGRSIDKDVFYWMPQEPNNVIPAWDKVQEGQDCIAIVAPTHRGQTHWLYTWDDIVCVGSRYSICETMAFT